MPQYPYLELGISIGTWDTVADVYPDNGFEGGLAIPFHLRHEIFAEPYLERVKTADGKVHAVPAWPGIVEIAGSRVRVQVLGLGDRFLIGREVLDQFEVCFMFGRRVAVRPE